MDGFYRRLQALLSEQEGGLCLCLKNNTKILYVVAHILIDPIYREWYNEFGFSSCC
jgi:hypothetical protein